MNMSTFQGIARGWVHTYPHFPVAERIATGVKQLREARAAQQTEQAARAAAAAEDKRDAGLRRSSRLHK
jgi:hypothetical protein